MSVDATIVECKECLAQIGEWCHRDEKLRKWLHGAPVHLSRIADANHAEYARRYQAAEKEIGK